ncbi:protein Wnt-4-like protein [Pitangus sulphuratus]|nr:protein Wnt-4-like protein [Pitangus sulphuratus]
MDRMEVVCLYAALILVQRIAAVTWLYLAKQTSLQVSLRDPRSCDGLMGLVEKQLLIYQWQVEAMDAVKRGVELAVQECQHQFHSRHWNCSTLQRLQAFGKVAIQGFQLSDCSDNLSCGIAFSQVFVVNPERSHGVSSSQALMNLHNNEAGRKVNLAVNEGKAVDVVYLDFSKAFDTVPHNILLEELAAHGLDRCTLSWVKNWLDG